MTINLPATRLTYETSVSISWRGVIGCVIRETDAWLFCLALGYRRFAFDQHGMLVNGSHSGVKGLVRFSKMVSK